MKTKTQQLTVSVQVPEDYEAIDFRLPRKGDQCISHYSGEVIVAREDFPYFHTRIIVRKVHKGPELLYCLQTDGCNFKYIAPKHQEMLEVIPIKKLNLDKYSLDGDEFDLILAENSDKQLDVWIGHWNDGLEVDDE